MALLPYPFKARANFKHANYELILTVGMLTFGVLLYNICNIFRQVYQMVLASYRTDDNLCESKQIEVNYV